MPGMGKKQAVSSKYKPLKGKPGKGKAETKKAGAKKPPFTTQPVKRGK